MNAAKDTSNSSSSPTANQATLGELSPLSPNRFSEIFPKYIAASDEKQQMVASYIPIIRELGLQLEWKKADSLKILDLGCGNGQTTQLFLELINRELPSKQIELHARDTDPAMSDLYSKKFKSAFPNVTAQVTTGDALNNLPNELKKTADITLVSHALYHVSPQNLLHSLMGIYYSLSSKGVAFVSLLSDTSDFNSIQTDFVGRFTSSAESHLTVGTPSFGSIKSTVRSEPTLAIRSAYIPYDASLKLPISSSEYESFCAWVSTPDPLHPSAKSYAETIALLEFMLHKDWQSLIKAGQHTKYLDLVEKLSAKNQQTPISKMRLNLSGWTLAITPQSFFVPNAN